MRISTLITCVFLAALATAMGFACGAAITPEDKLPGAGSARDDGSGVLARASSEDALLGLFEGGAAERPRSYGGRIFGGGSYGGTRYGNYHFDRGTSEWRSRPPRQYQAGYVGASAGPTGVLRGVVTWPKAPKPAPTLRLSRSSAPLANLACPDNLANDTLRIDKHKHVAGALVYLEGIYTGREGVLDRNNYNSALQLGGTLRMRECQFLPHVQVVAPLGSHLHLINSDRDQRSWETREDRGPGLTLAVGGLATRKLAMATAGFMEIRDERIPANAWVVVAGHPYYTITDENGAFQLYDVPPGTYTLVVWHEPVAIKVRDNELIFTEAVTYKTKLEVRANTSKSLTVKLPKAGE